MKWYHASPKKDLHKTGIDPKARPLVSKRVQHFVYFGSLSYIEDQYLQYAPRQNYIIYEVDVSGLCIDETELAGEQIRTRDFVSGDRLKKVGKAKNRRLYVNVCK